MYTKFTVWLFYVLGGSANSGFVLRAKEAADTQPDDGAVSRFPFVVWRHKIVNVCNSQSGLHAITAIV